MYITKIKKKAKIQYGEISFPFLYCLILRIVITTAIRSNFILFGKSRKKPKLLEIFVLNFDYM